MINNGYIKLHRSLLHNPIVMKDADHLAVWTYLLLQATFTGEVEVIFGGKRTRLSPGQFTTGRRRIAKDLGINESKIQRILSLFESEQQIEQRTDRQCRLISIVNWDKYQQSEQRNEQRMNNDRTTSEQRVNTKEERKKEKKDKNVYHSEVAEVVDYLNMITGRNYSYTSKATVEKISARIREGATVEDMKTVIDKKWAEWKGTDREQYVRPSTLFALSHFDEYLNQPTIRRSSGNVFIDLLQKKEEEQHDRERNHQSVGDAERLLWSGQG